MVEPQVIPADTSVFVDGVYLIIVIVTIDFLEFFTQFSKTNTWDGGRTEDNKVYVH